MKSQDIFGHGLKTGYDLTTGRLTITYTAIDKQFATQVLAYTLHALQQRFNALSDEKFEARIQHLQVRFARLNRDIQSSELQLQTLKKYGRCESDTAVVQPRNDIPQDQLPGNSATCPNLKDNLTLQETIYLAPRKRYETEELEANAKAKTFQIVEQSQVPEVVSGPSRGRLSMAIRMIAFVSFIMGHFDRVKQNPIESAKLDEIKEMLGGPRRA